MNIVPVNFGQLSTVFDQVPPQDDLSAGVPASFGVIGYRGKVWSTRYRGNEQQLMRHDGDGPRGSIEVVILKAAGIISKIWYEQGYVEGSHAPPDCFSTNGVTPDPASPKKQATICANCPRNVWGSKITPAGKATKECADSKRLAVTPLFDLKNEALGGPMLLRVPPASLQDMAQFGMQWSQQGFPYYSIGVRISFAPEEAYPKFQFKAMRPLSDEEAGIVMEMRELPLVARILAEGTEYAGQPGQPAQQAAPPAQSFEDPNFKGQEWQNQNVRAPSQAAASSPSPTPVSSFGTGAPTTGVASSPSARPAAAPGTITPAPTPSSSAPATPTRPAVQGNGFGTASTAPGGFGTAAGPMATSSGSSPGQEIIPPAQSTAKRSPADVPDDDEPAQASDAFENSLDEQLNALLPN